MNDPTVIPKLRRAIAEIEARKPLNRAEALAVICRQAGGILCGCGCSEPLDPLNEGCRDEHVIALGLTGTNGLGNREFWRLPCSRAKDKADAKALAKCKRLAGETGNGPKKQIPSHTNPWPDGPARKLGSGKLNGRKFQERSGWK
jgi:hypothetical protein